MRIRIYPADIISMQVFDENENVVLNDYLWYYSKEIDIKANHERRIAGNYVLGYSKEKHMSKTGAEFIKHKITELEQRIENRNRLNEIDQKMIARMTILFQNLDGQGQLTIEEK